MRTYLLIHELPRCITSSQIDDSGRIALLGLHKIHSYSDRMISGQELSRQSSGCLISDQALSEFQQLWLKEKAVAISRADALHQAAALLTLFLHIYKPVQRDWILPHASDNSRIQSNAEAQEKT
jgi:hypothetical protein